MSMNSRKPDLIEPNRFYSAYSKKNRELAITFPEDSQYTDQSAAADADINTIMARYQSTGELPVLNAAGANFLDCSDMDFTYHMQKVIEAKEMFAQLPSKIRDRFHNSPSDFLEFATDENNRVALATLGLLTPEATEAILWPHKAKEREDLEKAQNQPEG